LILFKKKKFVLQSVQSFTSPVTGKDEIVSEKSRSFADLTDKHRMYQQRE